MDLRQLTATQIVRLWDTTWKRMTKGDGYQPFGYDWITLKITHPGFYDILMACRWEMLRRLHG